jgi:hypothetical protein
MAKKVSESEMSEMMSMEGAGRFVPEGVKVDFVPDFKTSVSKISNEIIKAPNKSKETSTIVKRMGRPVPETIVKGIFKNSVEKPGNIESKKKTANQFKGGDLEFLRKMRTEQADKIIDSKKEDFRKKEGLGTKKKVFSEGGMVYGKSFKGIF